MEEEIESIGRLIRTLKNVFCPDCKSRLELRIRDDLHLIDGENVVQNNHYHYCNKCEYFIKIKNEKFSRKREWKPVELPPEPEPVKKWVKKSFDKFDKKDGSRDYSKPKFSKKG